MALSTRRITRLATSLACSAAVLLIVGVASATAEVVTHKPAGIKEWEKIADNTEGHNERETAYYEPGGLYVEGSSGGGDGTFEYTEECEEGYIDHECKGLHTVINQNSEGELPPGFIKFEHLVVESDYLGRRTVAIFRYGWSPESGLLGEENESGPGHKHCQAGYPVNCATGDQVVTQADLSVGGRGPALKLTRTYNSMLAATQAAPGPFGFGWTGSYSAHLELKDEGKEATVYQDNGSTVTFALEWGAWYAPPSRVQATLVDEGSGYVYTLPDQTALHFNSAGLLTSEVDRNGNALTMNRNSEGRLESISDAAGRKITLTYNSEGKIESAKDPMGHAVKYTYESGNLARIVR